MANAKRCDACGVFFPTPRCNREIRIVVDRGYLGDEYIDLCDECTEKLKDFIHLNKKEEQNHGGNE